MEGRVNCFSKSLSLSCVMVWVHHTYVMVKYGMSSSHHSWRAELNCFIKSLSLCYGMSSSHLCYGMSSSPLISRTRWVAAWFCKLINAHWTNGRVNCYKSWITCVLLTKLNRVKGGGTVCTWWSMIKDSERKLSDDSHNSYEPYCQHIDFNHLEIGNQ